MYFVRNNSIYLCRAFFNINYFLKYNAYSLFLANLHIIIRDFQMERLTIINRNQSDGSEQPCDDADGGHLRFPRRGFLLT